MNDVWDTLPHEARDDRLGLVYIPEITAQGGTWGPLLCSNSIDTVGKYSEESGQFYVYKKITRIIPLAMVDDLLSVRKCGFDSIETNITINTIIELKKLQFHIPEAGKKSKCHYLHVGKANHLCPGMKVHGQKAARVEEAVYLGDILRQDGKNSSNIKSRVNKGVGIVSKVMDILKAVSFGKKYFRIATTLREAELINGILTNAEVWYGINKDEMDALEEVDKLLLRRVLDAPASTCIESLYLELGLTPIHILVKARRINYLHYLVKLEEGDMLSKVFNTQWKHPVKDDWTIQVQKDLEDFSIDLSLKEIKEKSEYSFKRLVKIKMKEYTLDYLLNIKEKHSKMENLHYTELKLQNYLTDDDISVKEAKNLFKFRTRMARFKENFKNSYVGIACPLCLVLPDTQAHCVQCPVIKTKVNIKGVYSNIFSEDIPQDVSKTLLEISEFRENLL